MHRFYYFRGNDFFLRKLNQILLSGFFYKIVVPAVFDVVQIFKCIDRQ